MRLALRTRRIGRAQLVGRAMTRPRGWIGPATRDPGTAGPTLPTALHATYAQQLAAMLELVRSGEAFSEPAIAQRLSIRLVGVLTRLHEGHQVDDHGRCSICWPRPRRWWRPGPAARPAPFTPRSPSTCPTPLPPTYGGPSEHEVCRESRLCRRRIPPSSAGRVSPGCFPTGCAGVDCSVVAFYAFHR